MYIFIINSLIFLNNLLYTWDVSLKIKTDIISTILDNSFSYMDSHEEFYMIYMIRLLPRELFIRFFYMVYML